MLICDYVPDPKHASRIFPPDKQAADKLKAAISRSMVLVLDDEVTSASASVVVSKPTSVRDAVKVLRVPYQNIWVEWNEAARQTALRPLRPSEPTGHRPIPAKLGFHIQTDSEGRKAVVKMAWLHQDGVLTVAGYDMFIDFDSMQMGLKPVVRGKEFKSSLTLHNYWEGQPEQQQAIEDVYTTLRTMLTDEALMWRKGIPADVFEGVCDEWLADIFGEYFSIISIILLLTAKNGTTREPADLDKLNKARVKRGKPPFTKRDVVHMRLSKSERKHERGEPTGRHVRAHVVIGHYVTRGETIYWRRAHTRGGKHAEPTRRHVHA